MRELRLDHCATYDTYGVTLTPPETLRVTRDNDTITLSVGVDPLTRKDYRLNRDEALKLALWIGKELNDDKEGSACH